jgi:hypothetical protein
MAGPPPSGPPRLLNRETPPLKRIKDLLKANSDHVEWFNANMRNAVSDLSPANPAHDGD